MELTFDTFETLPHLIKFVNALEIPKEDIQAICKIIDGWVLIYWKEILYD